MVRAALVAISFALFSASATAQTGPWETSFPNGDEYRIEADRVDWLTTPRKVWISGFHLRNPAVPYRTSSQLLEFTCSGMVAVIAFSTYDARGNEIDNFYARQAPEVVRPDTLREWAQSVVCAK